MTIFIIDLCWSSQMLLSLPGRGGRGGGIKLALLVQKDDASLDDHILVLHLKY